MKKIILMMLVAAMLLMCTACGGEDTSDKNTSSTQDAEVNIGANNESDDSIVVSEDTETKDASSGEITMDDVLAHAESPASDFTFLDDGEGGLVLGRYEGSSEIVVIPESVDGKSVTRISTFVFSNDSCVKGVRLSSTVKEIEGFAFTQNKNLQYVVLSSGVEVIGESAFHGCSSMKEISMSEGVKKIEKMAFADCPGLKNISIPNSVESIGMNAFVLRADDFKIIGTAGSVAETYATEAGITFEAK